MGIGRQIARGLGAMIGGYALIVVLTTLGFTVWLGGADLYGGGPLLLFQGTLVAIVSGFCGGYLAGFIGGARPVRHSMLVLIPLAIDTAYVLFWFDGTAPVWFDALGSTTLMAFTITGGMIRRVQHTSRIE